jgi:hypothetical protein
LKKNHIPQRKFPLAISVIILPLIIYSFSLISISVLLSGCQKKQEQQQTANQSNAQKKDSIAANSTDTTKINSMQTPRILKVPGAEKWEPLKLLLK